MTPIVTLASLATLGYATCYLFMCAAFPFGHCRRCKGIGKLYKDSLTADRRKRLTQIAYQQCGLTAFEHPEVRDALKLTDDERKRIAKLKTDSVVEEAVTAIQNFHTSGSSAVKAEEQNAAWRRERVDAALSPLSDEQKKAWRELIGELFAPKP